MGAYFNYNKPAGKKANFDMTLNSIQKTLNMWKWRGLTLLGRIQIVKTFAIPKFKSRQGKNKVKRSALINDIDDGGLKMLNIQSMISAQWVTSLKSIWKTIIAPGSPSSNSF